MFRTVNQSTKTCNHANIHIFSYISQHNNRHKTGKKDELFIRMSVLREEISGSCILLGFYYSFNIHSSLALNSNMCSLNLYLNPQMFCLFSTLLLLLFTFLLRNFHNLFSLRKSIGMLKPPAL